jgi:cytochrome c-type biogenesis protein CcsB
MDTSFEDTGIIDASVMASLDRRSARDARVVWQGQDLLDENQLLKRSTSSLLIRLDNGSYRCIGLGFAFLTLGILSGAVWANEAWGSYWSWDPKETWALITWIIYALYLHVRLTKGWDGEKPSFVAIFGFFSVWLCYLGVNLLGSGLHSYGWFS